METIKINNTVLEFEKILYVSTSGNNTTGDGSNSNPYLTFDKALENAQNNYCIFIKKGIYRLNPIVIDASYSDAGIFDNNKAITIMGENNDTIIEFYGSDGAKRDNPFMALKNNSSVLMNLRANYYPPNKTENYSKSIFRLSLGTIKNVIFENPSEITWSYSYYNSGPANTPKIENCIFKSNGYSTSDYSGTPLYVNCLFDIVPSGGTKSYCIVRDITEEDLSMPPKKTSDLFQSGDPTTTNPDGSQAHIGVYGGEFAWRDWTSLFLFRDQNTIKQFNPEQPEWLTVPVNDPASPTQQEFEEHGMKHGDLSRMTGLHENYFYTMQDEGDLNDSEEEINGRRYRATIDRDKWPVILGLEVGKIWI